MKFLLTSAIPYVNAKPHVGHALEFTQTDVLARYYRLLGQDVTYLCGSDEHALKNVQAAEKEGKEVEQFCAENAQKFQDLAKHLSIKFDIWQRASAENHHVSSKHLWELCNKSGDIYKKKYQGLYCVGCETFYTKDELNENGECFEHPGKPLELVEEENYFFKLSKYKDQIYNLINNDELKIVPNEKKKEVLGFLKGEVHDISISRSKERARNWGVEVPEDSSQIMYVWFDALNIYQSGIGFGTDDARYNELWPAQIHLIGKGILRFHAVYWPAMLLSAKLKLPKSVYVHGYFTVNGQKMSKTLGNVIDPEEVIEKFGSEPLRYYFLREISTTEDGDFSLDRLHETYEANLANGLGNLVSRTCKLSEGLSLKPTTQPSTLSPQTAEFITAFTFREAMDEIWHRIAQLNKTISDEKPWEKEGSDRTAILQPVIDSLAQIAFDLQPFMPLTAEKIRAEFAKPALEPISPLFPRIAK